MPASAAADSNEGGVDPLLVRTTQADESNGFNEAAVGAAKVLGGKEYIVDPSRFDPAPLSWRTLHSKALKMLKPAIALALSPVVLFAGFLHTSVMIIGPESLKNRLLGAFVPCMMGKVADKFRAEREHLLSDVGDGDRVLDVGSGGGAYLRHLSRASEVIALEPVESMHPKIQKSAAEAGVVSDRLAVLACSIEEFLVSNPHMAGTFDWIVLGNVLCEVPRQDAALRVVDMLLRPGGKAYFSEHIGAPQGSWARALQDFVNPWWRTISGGCNCNRDTVDQIISMRGWHVVHWKYESVKVFMGPFVLGLIQKGDTSLPE